MQFCSPLSAAVAALERPLAEAESSFAREREALAGDVAAARSEAKDEKVARESAEADAKSAKADAETQARLLMPRASAEFTAPKTRPLHVKLDRLLKLILGRFAILWKGAIQMGAKRISLIGTYASQEPVKDGAS